MPTKADKEGWKPKSKEIEVVPKRNTFTVGGQELAPIENMDIEAFARQAAEHYNDPEKYSSFLTAWWHRAKVNRSNTGVVALNEYYQKLRALSGSARELQEEILRNKIIFAYQVEIAYQRVREQWAVEKSNLQYQLAMNQADTARQKFLTKFYETTNPSELSETALIIFSMLTPRSSSAFGKNWLGEEQSGSLTYGTPEGILQAKQQDKILEALLSEKLLELDERKARIRKELATSRQEEAKAEVAEVTAKKTKKDFDNL